MGRPQVHRVLPQEFVTDGWGDDPGSFRVQFEVLGRVVGRVTDTARLDSPREVTRPTWWQNLERHRSLPFDLTLPLKSAKSRRPMRLQLLAFFLLATIATAQTPPKPVRLIAEAEDFAVKSGWQVTPYRENYFASTFAVTFLSRMGCLTAAEQGSASAEQVVEIPAADEYQVLARYEQPYNFSCEFTIEIEQNLADIIVSAKLTVRETSAKPPHQKKT